MDMYEYKCFTDKGSWKFWAADDLDAIRMAHWLCWRDGERFVKVESHFGGTPYTLRICKIDKNNNLFTL